MIQRAIKALGKIVTDSIFAVIDIPAIPQELVDIVNDVFDYMKQGMSIINFFCPLDKIAPAIDIFVLIFACVQAYKLIMWTLRKIPLFGVS